MAFKPTHYYNRWLLATAIYYNIPEDTLLNGKRFRTIVISQARQVFLSLCVHDSICLYDLAITHGKHRCNYFSSYRNYTGVSIAEHKNNILKLVSNKLP